MAGSVVEEGRRESIAYCLLEAPAIVAGFLLVSYRKIDQIQVDVRTLRLLTPEGPSSGLGGVDIELSIAVALLGARWVGLFLGAGGGQGTGPFTDDEVTTLLGCSTGQVTVHTALDATGKLSGRLRGVSVGVNEVGVSVDDGEVGALGVEGSETVKVEAVMDDERERLGGIRYTSHGSQCLSV